MLIAINESEENICEDESEETNIMVSHLFDETFLMQCGMGYKDVSSKKNIITVNTP